MYTRRDFDAINLKGLRLGWEANIQNRVPWHLVGARLLEEDHEVF